MRVHGAFVVLLTICIGFSGSTLISDVVTGIDNLKADLITKEILQWAKVGVKSLSFTSLIKEFIFPPEWQRQNWATFDGLKANIMCTLCKAVSNAVITLKRDNRTIDTIENAIIHMCTFLHIQTRIVCYGVVKLNAPIILHIVDKVKDISYADICGLLLQNQRCTDLPSRYQWTVDIDNSPPLLSNVQPSRKSIKILQITDIHYDPLYEPGGNADCHEPTCCRRGQNNTRGNRKTAGFWGDFNYCDVPWHAVLDALDEMNTRHGDADLIYFTGDIIDHGIWETSRSMNSKSLHKIFKKIKETFRDRPVYPIFGNHEPHPLNQFAPDDIKEDSLSTKWLYKLSADIWIDAGWLPESTRETILQGGFYTVSPKKGFRIIAINNNVAYTWNWWIIYQPEDLNGQLKWLVKTLLEAEKNREIVHILGHMPGGSPEFQHTWNREYRKIVNRFAHIIAAQFNGHSHFDEFNVFYHPDNKSKVVNLAWNGGSITSYANVNPNYRVYHANANTYEVEDADTWVYNLTEANLRPDRRPNWHKRYSFREEYSLDDLSKDSLHNLIIDMAKGGKNLENYHKNYYKYGDPELEKECDKQCLLNHVCAIVTSSSDDMSECENLKRLNEPRKLVPLSVLGAISPCPFLNKGNISPDKRI